MQIALTVNNRPHYLQEVLESWSRVVGVSRHVMRFHIEPGNDEVLRLCRSVDFCRTAIVVNPERLGPLVNPWESLEAAFIRSPFVVLAEDDSAVSPDILKWFQAQRTNYGPDQSVLAVCSFQYEKGSDPAEARLQDWFSPTVWGTWKDRWLNTLRDTWDKDYSTGAGHSSGFDWNIRLRIMPQQGLKCVFPEMSRAQHIGKHDGAHMMPQDFEDLQSRSFLTESYKGEYRCSESS